MLAIPRLVPPLTAFDQLFLHPLSRAAHSYRRKVVAYGPVAYWMLAETSGTTARCQVDASQNGTHIGPTLGQTGIGDRLTCPYYDGINDKTNVYSITLASAFNGAEGTWMTWAKVTSAAEWSDGTNRHLFIARTANSFVNCFKWNSYPNRILLEYTANGVNSWPQITNLSTTDWFHLALTWSKAADQVKAYYNGSQYGSTLTSLGTWDGTLDSDRCVIGASAIASPTSFWKGWLAHQALFATPLDATAIADLYTIP